VAKKYDDMTPEERKALRDEEWQKGIKGKKEKDLNPRDRQERKDKGSGKGN
jgi:hypothetical protein